MRVLYSFYLISFILIVGCSKSSLDEASETLTDAAFTLSQRALDENPVAKYDDALAGIYKGTLGNSTTGFHGIVVINIRNSSDEIFAFISSTGGERIILEGIWDANKDQFIFKNNHGYFTLQVEKGKLQPNITGQYYGADLFGWAVKETSVRRLMPSTGLYYSTAGPSINGFFDITWTPNGDTYEPYILEITDDRYYTGQLFENSDPDIDVTYTRICTPLLQGGGFETVFILDGTAEFDRNIGPSIQRLSFQYSFDNIEPNAPTCEPRPSGASNITANEWQSGVGSGIILLDESSLPQF